ncbi:MAG: putative Transforming protein RhoA [Streblomastix strix]|uniref:Putative Transforming protein RhoA n=1 Tax=Streblomastix strix TaxID=222440 RepID=A0A5J4X188_9EUKA|nr:MAG: putative Transforming protein RhoA [Streblomastix strix]
MATETKLKLVIVGDGAVGKTCLLMVYANNKYPEGKLQRTVFDNYTCRVPVGRDRVLLSLWDTAGQEDYDAIRPFSYENTDVFIVCFSINRRDTFLNVKSKWVPDIKKRLGPKTKIVLVGTKGDLRKSITPTTQHEFVRVEEGYNMAKDIGASNYVECSAKYNQGVKEAFDNAISVCLKKDGCVIL